MDQTNHFSPREKEVINALLEGKSNKQIALALEISERTVEFHLKNLFEKMGVSSRVELILKLGKSTGIQYPKLVESTVEIKNQNLDNGKQTESLPKMGKPRGSEGSAKDKEFAMNTKDLLYLAPVVILLSLALIVGGIITQKYAAVVVGVSCAGAAAYNWITRFKNQKSD